MAVVEYLSYLRNQKRLSFLHPYNGGWRTPVEAAIGRALGVRAGAPDILIFWPGGRTWFVELKASPQQKLTPAQEEFKVELTRMGFSYDVAYSVDDVVRLVEIMDAVRTIIR